MGKGKGRKGRKAKSDLNDLVKLGVFIAGLLIVGSVIETVKANPGLVENGVVILVAAGTVVLGLRQMRRRRFDRHFDAMLEKHQAALLSCYRQSVYNDPFGNRVDAKWQREIDTFLRTQVLNDDEKFPSWRSSAAGGDFARTVDQYAEKRVKADLLTNPHGAVSAMDLQPRDYERLCADQLRRRGWDVQLTPPTRDGGADFVAQKGAHRIVVQCKRYAKPVGNKAVQEVYSALRLYGGTMACVVAPNGYTAQARREAFAHGIQLLDHAGLQAFADQVEAATASAR